MTLPSRRPWPVGGNRPGPPLAPALSGRAGSVGNAVGLRLEAEARDPARSRVLAAAECVALVLALALGWVAAVESVGGPALGTRLQPDRITARAGTIQASRGIKSRWPYVGAIGFHRLRKSLLEFVASLEAALPFT